MSAATDAIVHTAATTAGLAKRASTVKTKTLAENMPVSRKSRDQAIFVGIELRLARIRSVVIETRRTMGRTQMRIVWLLVAYETTDSMRRIAEALHARKSVSDGSRRSVTPIACTTKIDGSKGSSADNCRT
jgi:hypothetical protein